MAGLLDRIDAFADMMVDIEQGLDSFVRCDVDSRRHQQALGIDVLAATAISASACNRHRFESGRHFAAWLGLTPRAHSSGRTRKLGSITKRGQPGSRRATRAQQSRCCRGEHTRQTTLGDDARRQAI